ncbi:MAG: tetratricopeptide repeat protein [Candidatus Obscuribacterales bacterium]|nr:tetratricopeptide repeat protein [Candidatus Obscuribacterales bacterium]
MNKPILITIITMSLIVVLALLASVVYLTSESQRQGGSDHSSISHKLESRSKPAQVYEFMEESALDAVEDKEYDAAVGILSAMRPLARGFADKKRYLECTEKLADLYLDKTESYLRASELFNELLREKKESGSPSELASLKLRLGKAAIGNGSYQEAKKILQETLGKITATGDKKLEAECNYSIADAIMYLHDWQAAMPYAEKALDILLKNPQLGDKLELAKYYQELGLCKFQIGRLVEAADLLEKSVALSKEGGRTEADLVADLRDLAWLYLSMGDKEKSKSYLEKVAELESSESSESTPEAYILRRF